MKSIYNSILGRAAMAVLLCAFALASGVQRVSATHLAGGNITYTYNSGTGMYHIIATLYRDCAGIAAPTTLTVTLTNTCASTDSTVSATPVAGTPTLINPPCPGELTTCNGGTNPGIQKWQYELTTALSPACTDWVISYSENARNLAITTLVSPGTQNMYIEAHLNNSGVASNNSVQFSIEPILFVCIGQQFCFTPGASDPDGDSLGYSFICPRSDATTCIPYSSASYSVTEPLSSSPAVSINSATGLVCMTPTATEVAVMVVQIQEYRKVNGTPVLVGTTMRDIQIYTLPCTNSLPTLSGFNNGNSTVSICSGSQHCFSIYSNDADAGQQVSLQFVNPNGYPITFDTTTGTLHPTATVCITPLPTDIGKTFTFTIIANDNFCPVNGTQSQTYSVIVGNDLQNNIIVTGTPVSCHGGNNGSAATSVTGGETGLLYLWSPGNATSGTVTGLSAGTYCVTVSDATGCNSSQCVTITQPTSVTAQSGQNADILCHGGTTTVSVAASGGTPPYSGTGVSTHGAGTFSFIVTDAHGCTASTSVTITQPTAISASATKISDVPCGGGTGTVNVTASGGTPPYSGTGHISHSAGTWSFTVTDAHGCTAVSNAITLTSSSSGTLTVNAGVDETTYFGYPPLQTVTHTAAVSGGTGPYTYSWTMSRPLNCNVNGPSGDETFTAGNCTHTTCPASGTLTSNPSCSGSATVSVGLLANANVCVTVTDHGGCMATDCFTVFAVDARCGNSNNSDHMVAVCHATGSKSNPWVQLCIDYHAVPAHLNIGDYIGECTSTSHRFGTSEDEITGDELIAFPNPAHNNMTIRFNSQSSGNYSLKLVDMTGRTVMDKSGASFLGNNFVDVDMSNFAKGVYSLSVTDNDAVRQIRIIVE